MPRGLFDRVISEEPGGPGLTAARLLARAAAGLYYLGARASQLVWDLELRQSRRLPAPVIAVGNLTVGGTGKTPLVIEVVRALERLGWPAAVISRGYKGQGSGVRMLSTGEGPLLPAAEAGDEPVMLASRLRVPVAVGRDRLQAGRVLLARCGFRVLVADDLFQHRGLHRDLDLVCLDATRPLGNGRLLPAGPLREPWRALTRAHALVLTRDQDPQALAATRRLLDHRLGPKPMLTCRHRATALTTRQGLTLPANQVKGLRAMAFCGLARPREFARSLVSLGLEVLDLVSFADHHRFADRELARLQERASRLGADALVTSEKDAVRLPGDFEPTPRLLVTRLELVFHEGPQALEDLLRRSLTQWERYR